MKSKKGFVHFVEIVFAVLLFSFILSGFASHEEMIYKQTQVQNLKWQSWGLLNSLSEMGELDSALEQGNYSNLVIYIRNSLLPTQDFDIELYNSTGCYPISKVGQLGTPSSNCE